MQIHGINKQESALAMRYALDLSGLCSTKRRPADRSAQNFSRLHSDRKPGTNG